MRTGAHFIVIRHAGRYRAVLLNLMLETPEALRLRVHGHVCELQVTDLVEPASVLLI